MEIFGFVVDTATILLFMIHMNKEEKNEPENKEEFDSIHLLNLVSLDFWHI